MDSIYFLFLSVTLVHLSQQENAPCIPGVARYAADTLHGESDKYYDCTHGGEQAIISYCSDGEIFSSEDGECRYVGTDKRRKKRGVTYLDDKEKLKVMEEKTLGRDVYPGDFYDQKINTIWRGTSLYSASQLREKSMGGVIVRSPLPNSRVGFNAAKTTSEKMSKLEIHASLKLSFLGGLISVEGSASYLKDTQRSDKESRVNLEWYTTTHVLQIPTTTVPKHGTKYCVSDNEATHVVTAVKYGMSANFVFIRVKKKFETKENIEGELRATVEAFPGFSIEGRVQMKLEGELKQKAEQVKVNMFGDFISQKQPTNYEQAIEAYRDLPLLLQKYGNNSVPMSMILTPRSFFCDETDALLRGISKMLSSKMLSAVEEMDLLIMRTNTMMDSPPAQRFSSIRGNLGLFLTTLESFKLNFQQELSTLLPNIRGGTGDGERPLAVLLHSYIRSAFTTSASELFMSNRQREISSIQLLLNTFDKDENIFIQDTKSATDIKHLLEHEYTVVMQMRILQTSQVITDYLLTHRTNETGLWFNNDELVGKIGYVLRMFKDFANENVKSRKDIAFLVNIAYGSNTTTNPIFAAAYKDGVEVYQQSVNKKMLVPDRPNQLIVKAVHLNAIEFEKTVSRKLFEHVVKGFQISYRQYGKDDWTELPLNEDTVTLLEAGTRYEFVVKYVTEVGLSPPNREPLLASTLPSSPPVDGLVRYASANQIKVAWKRPHIVGKGVTITQYRVRLEDRPPVYTRGNDPARIVNPATSNGKPCFFPFRYNGLMYRECTTDNYKGVRWCALTSDYNLDPKKQWGICITEGCYREGIYYDGVPIITEKSVVSAKKCQQSCMKKDVCKAWSYATTNHTDVNLRSSCLIYHTVTTVKANANMIGGLNCEKGIGNSWREEKIVTRLKSGFKNLATAQQYVVTVYPRIDNGAESKPLVFDVRTRPTKPAVCQLKPEDIRSDGVDVPFSYNGEVASGATITRIIVSCMQYSQNGDMPIPDSETVNTIKVGKNAVYSTRNIGGPTFPINHLAANTYYGLKLKIGTSRGTSDYSDVRLFKTGKNAGDLNALKTKIVENVRKDYKGKFDTVKRAAVNTQTQYVSETKSFCDLRNKIAKTKAVMQDAKTKSDIKMKMSVQLVSAAKDVSIKVRKEINRLVSLEGLRDQNPAISTLKFNTQGHAYQGLVFLNNRPVCHTSHFTNTAARVVCRSLGFKDGTKDPNTVWGRFIPRDDYIMALSGPCRGDEKSLWDCPGSQAHAKQSCAHMFFSNGMIVNCT